MLNKIKRAMRPVSLTDALSIVLRMKKRGKFTHQWYESAIFSLVEFIGDDIPIWNVTTEQVNGWYIWINQRDNQHIPGKKLSAHTVHSYARAMRAYFNALVKMGHLDRSPFKISIPRPPKKEKKAISAEDIEKMVRSTTTLRDQALILCLRDAGCRLNALIDMRVANTSFNEVDGQLFGRSLVYDEKIDEWLHIFFQNRACEALRRYLDSRPDYLDHDFIWITIGGSPLSRSGAYQVFKRAGQRAGVHRFNPHAFRHAKVTRMLKNGAPPKIVQDSMGWKSPAMIQEYVQSTPDDIQEYNQRWDEMD